MNQINNFSYLGEISALCAAICWSIAVIIFKSASEKISPFLIVALKNTIALLAFFILFYFCDFPFWNNEFNNSDYIKIIISGCLGMGLGDILFIYALSQIGANRVAIINCFEPAVVYMFSIVMLGTLLTTQQFVGFVIVIISLLIITYEKDINDIDPYIKKRGLLLQICAVMLSSFGIVLIKPVLSKTNNIIHLQLWVTAFRLFPGFILAWIIFFLQKNPYSMLLPLKQSKIIWKILISSGMGTFIALSFWIIGYAIIEKPPIASIIGQTSVIFISILSWIFLKEKISKFRILSMTVAIIGVLLITIK